MFAGDVTLTPAQGKLRAALFELGAVEEEAFNPDGSCVLTVRLPLKDWERLQHHS